MHGVLLKPVAYNKRLGICGWCSVSESVSFSFLPPPRQEHCRMDISDPVRDGGRVLDLRPTDAVSRDCALGEFSVSISCGKVIYLSTAVVVLGLLIWELVYMSHREYHYIWR